MLILVKILVWMYSVVPRAVADHWGRMLGRTLYYVLYPKRIGSADAIKRAYPDWTDEQIKQTVKGVFRTQGLFISEVLRLFGEAKNNPLDMIDCDPGILQEAEEIQRQGKGLLVLTGHINNYELLLTWAAQRFPMSVITKKIKPPNLNDYFVKKRESNKINILPRRGSYRDAVRALRKGGVLGFIIDQNMQYKDGVHVTFFDQPANTTPGLAMMSAHAGVPVLPACLIREGNRYKLNVYPMIPPPADRKPETLHDVTQQYSNVVEKMIRLQPESWIWMHRRWKTPPRKGDRITRPDGSSYDA